MPAATLLHPLCFDFFSDGGEFDPLRSIVPVTEDGFPLDGSDATLFTDAAAVKRVSEIVLSRKCRWEWYRGPGVFFRERLPDAVRSDLKFLWARFKYRLGNIDNKAWVWLYGAVSPLWRKENDS